MLAEVSEERLPLKSTGLKPTNLRNLLLEWLGEPPELRFLSQGRLS